MWFTCSPCTHLTWELLASHNQALLCHARRVQLHHWSVHGLVLTMLCRGATHPPNCSCQIQWMVNKLICAREKIANWTTKITDVGWRKNGIGKRRKTKIRTHNGNQITNRTRDVVHKDTKVSNMGSFEDIFSLFIALWTTLCTENWKVRYMYRATHEWPCDIQATFSANNRTTL